MRLYKLKNDYWVSYSGYKHPKDRIFAIYLSQNGNTKSCYLSDGIYPHKTGNWSSFLEELPRSQKEEIDTDGVEHLKPYWHKEFREALIRFFE